MKVIHRFEIPIEPHFSLELPIGARIVHLDLQERAPHAPCFWVLLDPEPTRTIVRRTFALVGTGWPLEEGRPLEHVGTFQQQNGFVWHVFEVMM